MTAQAAKRHEDLGGDDSEILLETEDSPPESQTLRPGLIVRKRHGLLGAIWTGVVVSNAKGCFLLVKSHWARSPENAINGIDRWANWIREMGFQRYGWHDLLGWGGRLLRSGFPIPARHAFETSLAMSSEAGNEFDSIHNKRSHDVAFGNVLRCLAVASYRVGDFDAAFHRLSEAIPVLRHTYGDDSPPVALALQHLAQLVWQHGDYDEAKSHLETARKILVSLFGVESLPVQSLDILTFRLSEPSEMAAISPESWGNELAYAESYFSPIKRRKGVRGFIHRMSVFIRHSHFQVKRGQATRARRIVEAVYIARRCCELSLEKDLTFFLDDLMALAHLYGIAGSRALAERTWSAATKIARSLYADRMPWSVKRYADCLSEYGNVLQQEWKLDDALVCHSEAALIRRDKCDRAYVDISCSLNSKGVVLFHQGRIDDAIECYREALNSARQGRGNTQPGLAIILSNLLVSLAASKGNYDVASYRNELDLLLQNEKIQTTLNVGLEQRQVVIDLEGKRQSWLMLTSA